jgi:hypothetical protein
MTNRRPGNPGSTTFTLKNSTDNTYYTKGPSDCLSADSWVSLQPYENQPALFPRQCQKSSQKGDPNSGIERRSKALGAGESVSFRWNGKAFGQQSCQPITDKTEVGTKLPADFAWYDEPNLEDQTGHTGTQIMFDYGEANVRHVVKPFSTQMT